MRVDILFMIVSICASLFAGHVCRRVMLDRVYVQSKKNDGDIESNFPFVYIPIPFLIRHHPRIVTLASVVVFLILSFTHEWIQESLQIRGVIEATIARGPPEACEYKTHTTWLSWASSSNDIDRDRECQAYINKVNELPIANPGTALVRLVIKLIVDPWLYITSAIGEGLRSLLIQQTFATQLLLFMSVVVVLISTIQLCLFSVCNPDNIIGQCCIRGRTNVRQQRVRERENQFTIEEVAEVT